MFKSGEPIGAACKHFLNDNDIREATQSSCLYFSGDNRGFDMTSQGHKDVFAPFIEIDESTTKAQFPALYPDGNNFMPAEESLLDICRGENPKNQFTVTKKPLSREDVLARVAKYIDEQRKRRDAQALKRRQHQRMLRDAQDIEDNNNNNSNNNSSNNNNNSSNNTSEGEQEDEEVQIVANVIDEILGDEQYEISEEEEEEEDDE